MYFVQSTAKNKRFKELSQAAFETRSYLEKDNTNNTGTLYYNIYSI